MVLYQLNKVNNMQNKSLMAYFSLLPVWRRKKIFKHTVMTH